MGKELRQAAWTLFTVAAGAAAASLGAWWVLAVALVLGAGSFAVQSRWVQQRVPFLRTPKQRLAGYYDSCFELRRTLARQSKAKELEPVEAWREHVLEWDRNFWAYMQRTRDDWRPLKRAIPDPPGKAFANWVELVRRGLEARLTLIKDLLAE